MSVPTQNDCTGDYLLSKAATDSYRDNYDAIFGKKVKSEVEVAPIKKESKSMKEVKRYDAVHIRYEESNIRYCEGCEVERIRLNISEYNEAISCYQSERDQQAQRIGELEGLLLRVQVSLSLDDTEWGYSGDEKYKLLADIRASLSDCKEGE